MRLKRTVAAVALLGALQGCSVMNKVGRSELRHSGGYPGRVLDRHFFNASGSKDLQLLRMTMLVALASRVGVASIRDGREAEAFVGYLRNASDEINFLAAHLYGGRGSDDEILSTCSDLRTPRGVLTAARQDNGASPAETNPLWLESNCATYYQLFESELPDLEYKVIRLLLAALPQEQAAQLASAIRSGNVFGVAWRLLRLASASLDGAHRGAAVYRTSQEVLAVGVLARDRCAPNAAAAVELRREIERVEPGAADEILSIERAADCLGRSRSDLLDDRAREGVTLPRQVPVEAFRALYAVAFTSCRMLPIPFNADEDKKTASEPGNNTQVATDRRGSCEKLTFSPRLRYGRIPSIPAKASQSDQQPGTASPQPEG